MPATVNATQGKQLSDIKTTLQNLSSGLSSMSPAEKAKFEASSQSSGMGSVLSASSNYLGTLQNVNGVVTSKSARNSVNGAKDTLAQNGVATSNDAFSKLQKAYADSTAKYETEKAARVEADANLSIADKRKQQAVADAVAQAKGGIPVPTPATPGTPNGTGTDGKVTPTVDAFGKSTDPVVVALEKHKVETTQAGNTQMATLTDMFKDEDSDTKLSIANAQKLAQTQTDRISKENERLRQAAQVAGIVSGRGMYSPYEHEGIISEVVQEGLGRIQEIEYTKQETILTAKKALRDFKYKTFTEATKLVQDLADMKRQTVLDMSARLTEIDKSQREKQNFDNEQADRNALILAPEMFNATPDEIYKAALANGIEVGALSRAIADYKYEQQSNSLNLADKSLGMDATRLGMDATRESIKTSQYNRYLAGLKASTDKEEKVTPMDEKGVERFKASYGWTPPYGMSFDAALALNSNFKGEPSSVKESRAKEIILGEYGDKVKTTVADVTSLAGEDQGVTATLKQIGGELGIGFKVAGTQFNTNVSKVTSNPRFNEYLTQVLAKETAGGTKLTTRQRIELVAAALENDRLKEETRKKTIETNANKGNAPFQSSNSTQSVIIK